VTSPTVAVWPGVQHAIATPDRSAVMDRLERERFDCVVVGGGISGAGIARAAAQRGLSVALLEANDFAAGTSSRSSKLIHGGLRYLAMGDVGLVRTTARERVAIQRLAPHLAEPRWMVVPARSRAGLLKFRAGIATYEKLGAVAEADRHRIWSGEELARQEPLLDREAFPQACVYREYLTDDAHLVLATLRSAIARGAAALNYARVDALERSGGVAEGALARCSLTGRRVRVRARCVINAAGPWIESIQRLEDASARPVLHLSKGVHVVVPASRFPVENIVILGTPDRRSIFAIRRGSVVVIGTTDTSYSGTETGWPEITRDDVEYLLGPLARTFTGEPLRASDIVAAWSGLRPLIAEPGKRPHEISRRDEISVGPARVITLAGGKLTGFRSMAAATVEKAAEVCGLDLAPAPIEDSEPLPGGDLGPDLAVAESALCREFELTPDTAARLVRLYGSEAREICLAGTEPLVANAPVLASEVRWAVLVEGAATLEDVLYRRIRSALFLPEAREASVQAIADRIAPLLEWSDDRIRTEIDRGRSRLEADLEFRAESPAPG
jgi:glycerol-3-phosphate dehydrogenase